MRQFFEKKIEDHALFFSFFDDVIRKYLSHFSNVLQVGIFVLTWKLAEEKSFFDFWSQKFFTKIFIWIFAPKIFTVLLIFQIMNIRAKNHRKDIFGMRALFVDFWRENSNISF